MVAPAVPEYVYHFRYAPYTVASCGEAASVQSIHNATH